MASKGLNATSIVLGVVSTLFFIVGAIGITTDNDSIKNVAWITSSKDGLDVYVGLSKVYETIDIAGQTIDFGLKFSSSECSEDFCNKCERDGKAAVALNILAIIFTLVVVGMSGFLVASPSRGVQTGSAVVSLLVAIFSLVAVGVFMGDCYNALDDATRSDDDTASYSYVDDNITSLNVELKWGPGAIVTLVGMLLMWLVVVFQVAAACTTTPTLAANQA